MGIKSVLIRPYARYLARKVQRDRANAVADQLRIFQSIIRKAVHTHFGRDHDFAAIRRVQDFQQRVPLRDYEALLPWVDRMIAGEADVLWPGRPKYYAMTSGTTSGKKYIPLTKDSIPNHFGTARNAVMNYMAETGNYGIMDGKMMFLSGSPELEYKNGVLTGRLSGISNHMIPGWLKFNQKPSYVTNCIADWEEKLDAVVRETEHADMRMISGIPPWVLMYFEKVAEKTGKRVSEVFPHFELFVYGGVNYEPYRAKMEAAIGKPVASLETYPASEGFIAFQDSQEEPGLLLNTNSGIFFEFIPADQFFDNAPPRLTLEEVSIGVNYVLIINSNAGLWGYNIGDTVKFVSIDPYRLVVTGRIAHFISAFGEHVIAEEVEQSLLEVSAAFGAEIVEFHVAPQVSPSEGLPYHEWFIEFGKKPEDMERFATALDVALQRRNAYYEDLLKGNVLRPLVIRSLPVHAFRDYMKSQGKLGGQNKVPRLANDRKIAEELRVG